ncbi:MAG: regulatory protein RecX [Oscillospiraceae bacterium]|nr:regulatory protein RecX [Oscillospiraceae bacterium]
MRITALKQVTAEHVTIIFADETEVKSTLGVVTELRLFSGKELNDREMEALIRDSCRALMREKALELVSQRQMSAKELSRKLRDKGADEETAVYCVQWILERGLIDEERYAAAIVRHYAAKGYGEGRMRQELIRRGVPRELWEDALEQMPEDTTKLDRLVASKLRDPEDRDAVRKLSASLYRRGYSGEEIRMALERARASFEYEE